MLYNKQFISVQFFTLIFYFELFVLMWAKMYVQLFRLWQKHLKSFKLKEEMRTQVAPSTLALKEKISKFTKWKN